MKMFTAIFAAMTAASLAAAMAAGPAYAGVTAEEAAKLKSTLTPLGGERAGNADGSIPAWDGGYKGGGSGPSLGDIPTSIFPNEKPIYKIDAASAGKYDKLLSDGSKALLKKYPDSFRIDVYPTRRTARASDAVYAAVAANAVRCETTHGGVSLKGCAGGIPFPIPKQGVEVMWNHLLRIEGASVEYSFKNIVVNSDGSHTLATRNQIAFQYPPYYPGMTPESWSGEYAMLRFNTLEPPFKAGESLVIRDSADPENPRTAWQYLLGQRRVRRAPTVAYDTPDFVASGANYFDEVMGLFGALDRYTWRLVGKREMLIPYNNNNMLAVPVTQALSTRHLNPDHLRWEKHRVWEVEATVAPDKRHAVPKRTYYVDEDTGLIALMDGYDAKGQLWRTTQLPQFVVPAIPANVIKTAAVFNLQANTMSVIQLLNEENYKVVAKKSENYFTGNAVAADSAR